MDEEGRLFKCTTALGTEVYISLFFGDWMDYVSEICVTSGEETKRYMTNSNSKTEKRVPKATLEGRTIKRCGKEVASYYCEFFCHRTVKLDDTHILKVELDEPNKHEKKSEISVLRNYEDVEEYLLGLDTSLDVDEVYGNMMKFLNFSVAGDRNSIIDTYPGEIMDQVSMKISNLWRFVK